jgi:hypothetical protein
VATYLQNESSKKQPTMRSSRGEEKLQMEADSTADYEYATE